MTKKECGKNCSNCKTCQNECSSCRQYQEKAFELEVDEEMEQERLTQMWHKYRGWIFGGVSAILLLTAGIQIYRSWWQGVRLKESDAYENAVMLANGKKYEEAQKAFEDLSKTSYTGYQTLSQMQLADLFMQQNKVEQSLQTWKKIVDDCNKKDSLCLTAILSYTGYQIESGDPQQMLALLQPALDNPYFQGLATEIAVVYLTRLGDKEKIETLVKSAFENQNLTEQTRSRLNNLVSGGK